MKYLFFDIECASVFKTVAKICAFGYCLTDEAFRVSEKRDVLINPQGGFHLTDRKGIQGLVLPYEYDDFKKYPTFPNVAKEIYALLEDRDTLVVGHATMNDVKYLNLESKRFNLRSFAFSFADTQFLYMNKIGEFNRQFALGTIAEKYGVDFTQHCAADDAYATMKVAEAMCKEEGLSLTELLKKYEITLGRIEKYEVAQSFSSASLLHAKEAAKRKEERERKRAAFHEYVEKEKRKRNKKGKLNGVSVSFSRLLEENDEKSRVLVTGLFEKGCTFSYRAENCEFYVCFEGETGQRRSLAAAHGAKIMTEKEFASLIGTELA